MTVQNIRKQALKLGAASRAKLASVLLSSLDNLSESENERLWGEEASRRDDEIMKGKVKTKSASAVFRNARARVK